MAWRDVVRCDVMWVSDVMWCGVMCCSKSLVYSYCQNLKRTVESVASGYTIANDDVM